MVLLLLPLTTTSTNNHLLQHNENVTSFFLAILCRQKSTTDLDCLLAFYLQQMRSHKQFPTSEFYGGILASTKRSSWERGANLYLAYGAFTLDVTSQC
jgi:hypothetical protein